MPRTMQPTIVLLDQDPARRDEFTNTLESWYGPDFRILPVTSGQETSEVLTGLNAEGRDIALVAGAGDHATGLTGAVQAAKLPTDVGLVSLHPDGHPAAAVGGGAGAADLAVDYLDGSLLRQFDSQIYKWWHQASQEIRDAFTLVEITGSIRSKKAFEIREFLTGSSVVFKWPEKSQGTDIVVKVTSNGQTQSLRNPTLVAVANALGLLTPRQKDWYDVVIVGGGPAGLSAAVYSGAEGLQTLVIEDDVPGGQAGTSSKIANYLGFPHGIPGRELAKNALQQAKAFGVEWQPLNVAKKLHIGTGGTPGTNGTQPLNCVELADGKGTKIKAGAVVVASGFSWRRLDDATKANDLIGQGVFYQALVTDAEYFKGKEIVLVGGGNSAGQAIVHYADYASKIHVILRHELSKKMSKYLVDQIKQLEKDKKVRLVTGKEVKLCEADQNKQLTKVKIGRAGKEYPFDEEIATQWLYVLIGGTPNNQWLDGQLALDSKTQTVLTGRDVPKKTGLTSTAASVPGVYAIGDIQFGTPPRVGGAVGRGAAFVSELFGYMEKEPQNFPSRANKKPKNQKSQQSQKNQKSQKN